MKTIADNAAYIIKRIKDVRNESPGKKVLQKIVFLTIEKGIPFDYDFGLHFYGPYSSSLDEATNILHAEGVIHFDYSGQSHKMEISDGFEVLPSKLTEEQINDVNDVIQTFMDMSPSDLELLTTAIYAFNHLDDKSKESVVSGVIKIKGKKYSPEKIYSALNRFEYFNKVFS